MTQLQLSTCYLVEATHPEACVDVLASYADVAASTSSSADCHPALQRLKGWSSTLRCMEAIARIPSLTELLQPHHYHVNARWDLSPLRTADLQPLLARLHTFESVYTLAVEQLD